MADLHDLGAAETVRRIRSGALSPVDFLNACLTRIDTADPLSSGAGIDDYVGAALHPVTPRLGFLRSLLGRATPEMASHVDAMARAFESAGALVEDVEVPPSYARVHEAGNRIVRAEAAASHAPLLAKPADEYPPKIREALEQGRHVLALDYLASQHERRVCGEEMAAIAARYDALVLPTAGAPAPRGLGSTGDPYCCAPWSFSGLPAIALPSGVDRGGLPLSVQLVGGVFAEARLLGAAAWCEQAIGFSSAPRL